MRQCISTLSAYIEGDDRKTEKVTELNWARVKGGDSCCSVVGTSQEDKGAATPQLSVGRRV